MKDLSSKGEEDLQYKVQHCGTLSLPRRPLGALMARNEFSSIVFTQELEEKLFLVHRSLQAGQGPKVHCVLVRGPCLLWISSRLQQRRKEENFFFFFNPEAPLRSSSAPFILVGCNFTLDTRVHLI